MVYVPWACVEEAQNILSPRLGRRGGTREPVKMGKWKDLLLCLDLIAGEGEACMCSVYKEHSAIAKCSNLCQPLSGRWSDKALMWNLNGAVLLSGSRPA